jgi:hypothetical protein
MSTNRAEVEEQIETLRQHVIQSRSSNSGQKKAEACLQRLNDLYAKYRSTFTAEDVRFVNVLRGFLGCRYEAHKPRVAHTKKAKRKGDKIDHCWRCSTPIDERFTEMCPTCSEKSYQWRICPVCAACGCQRAGTVLV